jgi:anti-sigma factor RsiW
MGMHDGRCDRARDWVSLRTDGELTELESALLEAHLKRCPACAAFAVGVAAVAQQLRAAALERFEQRVQLPTHSIASPLRAVRLGSAAALVAAAVGLGTLLGAVGTPSHQSTLTLKLPHNSALLAFDSSPRGLPTTRQAALERKPPAPIPRNLALPDV